MRKAVKVWAGRRVEVYHHTNDEILIVYYGDEKIEREIMIPAGKVIAIESTYSDDGEDDKLIYYLDGGIIVIVTDYTVTVKSCDKIL